MLTMNSSCNTSNSSCGGSTASSPHAFIWYTDPFTVPFVILYSLTIISAIIGNILVCSAVLVNANLRQLVSSYFIVSLAISDLATACFSMPFDMEIFITNGKWPREEAFCIVWTTVYMIAIPTSILNLLILSIDRYKTLKDPYDRFRESPFMTPCRAVIIIIIVWGYCLAYALVPIIGVKYYPSSIYKDACIFNITPIYSVVASFVNFVVPMAIMCGIYYKIFQIAHTKYRMPSRPKRKENHLNQPPAEPLQRVGNRAPTGTSQALASINLSSKLKNRYRKRYSKKTTPQIDKVTGLQNAAFELSETERPRISGIPHQTVITGGDNSAKSDHDGAAGIKSNASCNKIGDSERDVLSVVNKCENSSDKTIDLSDLNVGPNESASQPGFRDTSSNRNEDIMSDPCDGKILSRGNDVMCATNNELEDASLSPEINQSGAGIREIPDVGVVLDKDEGKSKNDDDTEIKDDTDEKYNTATAATIAAATVTQHGLEKDNRLHADSEINATDEKLEESSTGTSPDWPKQTNQPNLALPLPYLLCSRVHVEIRNSLAESNDDTSSVGTCDTTESPVLDRSRTSKRNPAYTQRTGSESPDSYRKRCSTMQTEIQDEPDSRLPTNVELKGAVADVPPHVTSSGSAESLTLKRKKVFVKNRKAARTISIIVSAFLLCWGPFVVDSIVMNLCWQPCLSVVPHEVHHVFLLMGYLNSVLNPLLFSYQNAQFRRAYWKILMAICPCAKRNEVLPR